MGAKSRLVGVPGERLGDNTGLQGQHSASFAAGADELCCRMCATWAPPCTSATAPAAEHSCVCWLLLLLSSLAALLYHHPSAGCSSGASAGCQAAGQWPLRGGAGVG
jgi:hypothetical protein